jgi:hypothetical protein
MFSQTIEREASLLKVNKVNPCYMCGGEKDKHNRFKNLCENCDFWSEKLEIKDHKNVARIANEHYIIGSTKAAKGSKGFGGMEVTIKFFDGREVSTDNLWHQGRIPIAWRKRLPNNAKFVDYEKKSDTVKNRKGERMTFFANSKREHFGIGVVVGLAVATVVVLLAF